MEDCIFCKIVKKEVLADIIYEDDWVVALKDIHPKAPIHILVMPKKHIVSLNEIEDKDKELLGGLLLAVKKIAKQLDIRGYKIISNVGREGGQSIDHLHMHILSGDYSHLKEI